jgi:hypothetical protein
LLDDISDKQWESLFRKSTKEDDKSKKEEIKKLQKKIEKKKTPNDPLNELLKEMQEDDSDVVRLGDASIASPFTSKVCQYFKFNLEIFHFIKFEFQWS